MRKRRVILLGATGSIGTSAIKVAESMPDRMEIIGMAAYRSAQKLAVAANRSRPEAVCLVDPAFVNELRSALKYSPKILTGDDGLIELSTMSGADLVLVAIIGTAGGTEGLGTLQQGYVEESNVSVVDEFINLITSQRAYEANSKVVKAADEMYQQVNNLKQ